MTTSLTLQVTFHTIVAPCVPIYSPTDPQRRLPWDVRIRAHLAFIVDAITARRYRAGPILKDVTFHGPDNHHWSVAWSKRYPEAAAPEGSVLEDCLSTALISPLYHVTKKTNWKRSFTSVLTAVAARCNWTANSCTDLCVLVGRSIHDPEVDDLSLVEMQRIAMLVCRFEDVLDTLCGDYRIPESDKYLSVRRNDYLRDLTLTQVYRRIKSTTSKGDLAALVNQIDTGPGYLSGQYNFKVDFKAFSYRFIPIYRNVQFRQHRATVSPGVAIYWTDIVFRFVDFAITSTDEVIMGEGETLEDFERLMPLPPVPDSHS